MSRLTRDLTRNRGCKKIYLLGPGPLVAMGPTDYDRSMKKHNKSVITHWHRLHSAIHRRSTGSFTDHIAAVNTAFRTVYTLKILSPMRPIWIILSLVMRRAVEKHDEHYHADIQARDAAAAMK